MDAPHRARTKLWKPRYTIGGLMATIVAIALVLAALRPIAGLLVAVAPQVAPAVGELATFENGVVLSCLAIGAFVTLKLMSLDEKT